MSGTMPELRAESPVSTPSPRARSVSWGALGWIARRLLASAVTMAIVVVVLFVALRLMPGTPFSTANLTTDQVEALRHLYRFDEPIWTQFGSYAAGVLRGDFGTSLTVAPNQSAFAVALQRWAITGPIALRALVIGVAAGILLGAAMAMRRGRFVDHIGTGVTIVGMSLPAYVFAIVLTATMGYQLHLLPTLYSAADPERTMALPMIALAIFPAALVARYVRTELVEALQSPFADFAHLKGVSPWRLVFVHGLRLALLPVLAAIPPLVLGLLTGGLVIEQLYSIPGIGSLFVQAIQANDYNVVIAAAFLFSAVYTAVVLIVDILYGVVDPRIRVAKGARGGA